MTNGDNPDYNIIKIGQNTKSCEDLLSLKRQRKNIS